MTRKIAQLIQQQLDAEQEKRRLELDNLQAQISPTFVQYSVYGQVDGHSPKCSRNYGNAGIPDPDHEKYLQKYQFQNLASGRAEPAEALSHDPDLSLRRQLYLYTDR